MRTESLIALLPILSFASCGYDQDPRSPALARQPYRVMGNHDPWAGPAPNVDAFDITQRTCAMYVAVRSRAFDETPGFGRDIDSGMIHWNMCTGGSMVACAEVPAENGEPVRTGIPWPYAPPQQQ